MPTLDIDEHFEGADLSAYTLTGAPALSTAAARNGAKGMIVSGAGAISIGKAPTASKTCIVHRLYFRVPSGGLPGTLPAVLVQSTANSIAFQVRVTTGGIMQAVHTGGTQQNGPTIVQGQWYRLDARFDCSANTYTIDWQIDGVTRTQATFASTASTFTATAASRRLGNSTAGVTAEVIHYDEWASGYVSAEYPFGAVALDPVHLSGAAARLGLQRIGL